MPAGDYFFEMEDGGRPKARPWSRPKGHWLTREAWDDAYIEAVLDIAIAIDRIAEQENVPQAELAERTGFTTKHVNHLLRGKANSLRGLVYLLGALGYDLEISVVRKPEDCFESIEESRSSRG